MKKYRRFLAKKIDIYTTKNQNESKLLYQKNYLKKTKTVMRTDKILVIGSEGQIGTVLSHALRDVYGIPNVITSDLNHPRTSVIGYFEKLNVWNTLHQYLHISMGASATCQVRDHILAGHGDGIT